MARKIKRTAAKRTKPEEPEMDTMDMAPAYMPPAEDEKPQGIRIGWVLAGILAIAALALLTKQGLIIAAIVNGKPIFSWEVNRVMAQKYGKQTVEGMITEALIADAARKQNIAVTQKDIDDKEAEILKSFGDKVSLDDLLKFQGMSRAEFDEQLRLQILVTKLLGKDIEVSDKEISDYIASNSSLLTATTEAAMKEEAKAAIFNQKLSDKVQPWYAQQKASASIIRFP